MKSPLASHASAPLRPAPAKKHESTAMTGLQRDVHERINVIASKMLDAAEAIVEKRAAAPDRPSVAVVRRQVANRLAVWNFCPNSRCRRARCCRGEPSQCLRVGLPLMPDALVGLLKMRRPRRRQSA